MSSAAPLLLRPLAHGDSLLYVSLSPAAQLTLNNTTPRQVLNEERLFTYLLTQRICCAVGISPVLNVTVQGAWVWVVPAGGTALIYRPCSPAAVSGS